MPSSYTAKISEGCSFKEYAISTMRQFGACVMLREEDGKVIPTQENVKDTSTYYEDRLAKAIKESERSDESILIDFDEYIENKIDGYREAINEHIILKFKYEDMIKKVETMVSPSADHNGWKDFMIKQINDSIEWDCGIEYYEEALNGAHNLTPEQYLKDNRDSQKSDIEYNTKHLKKQNKGNDDRAEWVKLAIEAIEKVGEK